MGYQQTTGTNRKKSIYVLGTGLSHDGSACLLKDGEILVAIEKERVTRRKHDGGNDTVAINYCLDAAGISISDIDLVVQNANFGMEEVGQKWWRGSGITEHSRVVTISHQLAHAYSALANCPFDEGTILVIDGYGNYMDECIDLEAAQIASDLPSGELRAIFAEKDSYYSFQCGEITPLYKDFSPMGMIGRENPLYPNTTRHSIGGLYAGASIYVFNGLDDSGKLMGLAPYGRPGIHDFEMFDLRDGRVFVRYEWMKQFDRPARSYQDFVNNFQYYADFAYWVQREVERALLYIVRSRHEMAPVENLAYAGGVALNAVANRRIIKETPFERIYIQPAAGDNGLAIDCALYGWLKVLGGERKMAHGLQFFGRSYSQSAVEAAIARFSDRVTAAKTPDYVSKAAELLAEGKTVAWYQGGAEFGPRALGHRSILADPRRTDVRDFINARIKFREDFRPFAPTLQLPTDRARPTEQSYRGLAIDFKLSPELTASLKDICRREGTTLLMMLLAGWQLLLSRYSGQEDLVVGSPIANRNRIEIENLVGFFVNTLVLRADLSGNPAFPELLRSTRTTCLAAYAYQDIPFEQLVEEIAPARDMSRNPLFQVMIILQNVNSYSGELVLTELTLDDVQRERRSSHFDMMLTLNELSDRINGSLEYATDLFDAATIERMIGCLQTLLAGIVANPSANISGLSLISDAERRQLLFDFNDIQSHHQAAFGSGALGVRTGWVGISCVHQIFEMQVENTPDAVAVSSGDDTLTYAALNARANVLACCLHGRGIGPDARVGLLVDRSLDMVVGILGVLKTGAAYVPIDPVYPDNRIAFMLQDAGVALLLTQANLRVRASQAATEVLLFDDMVYSSRIPNHTAISPEPYPSNLAYVIYTSGSTGRPKGVAMPHGALVNLILTHADRLPPTHGARTLQFASPSFDVCFQEQARILRGAFWRQK